MDPISLLIIGVVLGAGGTLGISVALGMDRPDKTVQAAADVVERTGDAVNEVPLAEARIAEALAQTPPVVAVLQMAAEKGATAEQLLAFASQESCWSHVEGEETSAGLGCLNRSAVLDALLTAPPVEPAP